MNNNSLKFIAMHPNDNILLSNLTQYPIIFKFHYDKIEKENIKLKAKLEIMENELHFYKSLMIKTPQLKL